MKSYFKPDKWRTRIILPPRERSRNRVGDRIRGRANQPAIVEAQAHCGYTAGKSVAHLRKGAGISRGFDDAMAVYAVR
jgi:hypothetical protein